MALALLESTFWLSGVKYLAGYFLAKSLQFSCGNADIFLANLHFKCKDMALSLAPRLVEEFLNLRNLRFLDLDLLFPQKKVIQANKLGKGNCPVLFC